MGAIKVHEFTTLDGSVGVPMWTADHPWTEAQTADTAALTAGATAILLGRTTYEMFAPVWSQRTAEDDPGAPFFNDTHKYVVSSTLSDPSWGPASVLAYDPLRIARLKDEVDGDVYVSGSGTLVRRCWPTVSSTSCTCSSTRSGSVRVPTCCRRAPPGSRSACCPPGPTRTASCT